MTKRPWVKTPVCGSHFFKLEAKIVEIYLGIVACAIIQQRGGQNLGTVDLRNLAS